MDNKKETVEEVSQNDTEKKLPEFRGLYKHVKISVKALDIIIVTCIVVILVVVAIDLRNPGFTITFDSKGGTDILPQNYMYGEFLEVPEEPTREGYEFTGWYIDHACDEKWNPDEDIVESDFTLYAGWEKKKVQ